MAAEENAKLKAISGINGIQLRSGKLVEIKKKLLFASPVAWPLGSPSYHTPRAVLEGSLRVTLPTSVLAEMAVTDVHIVVLPCNPG